MRFVSILFCKFFLRVCIGVDRFVFGFVFMDEIEEFSGYDRVGILGGLVVMFRDNISCIIGLFDVFIMR